MRTIRLLLLVTLLSVFPCAPATAQHSKRSDVYVKNNTSYYFGVNIEDKSWMINPWVNSTRLTYQNGDNYRVNRNARVIIVCNQRGFRRQYSLENVASRKGDRWTIDLATLIQSGRHHDSHH